MLRARTIWISAVVAGIFMLAAAAPSQTTTPHAAGAPESHSPGLIAKLHDLHLTTDLSRAKLVIGSNPLQAELAGQIAEALGAKLGHQPEVVKDSDIMSQLPAGTPLILLGNLSDNRVVRKLYCEWFCMVDKVFPGENGYLIQTIHDPWGAGENVVLLGASDDAGLRAAAARFLELAPTDGRLGRVYDLRPAPAFAALRDFSKTRRGYLVLPLFWPQYYGLRNTVTENAMAYLFTGDDHFAELCRQGFLKQTEAGRLSHLYYSPWPLVWQLMERHPVFTDEDRLKITNYLLEQLRSDEGIGFGLIRDMDTGVAISNHGTRCALGCFFTARYLRDQYHLPEAEADLKIVSRYFGRQATWSKPLCDCSWEQWNATLEDKAIYALASGETEFFDSGAARQAAERALRTTNNLGLLPSVGDMVYGLGADSFLAKAAFNYDDPRYLWPLKQRGATPTFSDELGRSFTVHAAPKPPADIIGVSICPYDKGFWSTWPDHRPAGYNYRAPNIPFDRAFDKIAFRTGIDRNDEFLCLDGMLSGAHDYEDTNTLDEYSRDGRIYLTTADNLLAPTMPHHNGVNIVRDGLSTQLPSAAECLHAERLDPVMVSRTRLNDFAGADWTRTVVLRPAAWFVVLDRVVARQAGVFTLTGHWRLLGEPRMEGNVLTVSQYDKGDSSEGTSATFFHMQATGEHVARQELCDREGSALRATVMGYPFAQPTPQGLAQSRTMRLGVGDSAYLCALGHSTGHEAACRFQMREVAPGVVRVTDGKEAAYVGAPVGPVRIGLLEVDADLFYLDATRLCVAGGRRAVVDGKTLLDSAQPVSKSVTLEPCEALTRQLASAAHDVIAAPAEAQQAALALTQVWRANVGGEVRTLRGENLSEDMGLLAVPIRLGKDGASGKVVFLDAAGRTAREIEEPSGVNDVAVADLDGDGHREILIAREDCELQCLDAAGKERFTFRPAKEQAVNSNVCFSRNSMQRVWVADHGNGKKTIVVSSGDQRVHGLTPAGVRNWCFWAYAGIFTTFGMCDVDGNGEKLIVGGNGQLSAYDHLWFLKDRDTFYKRIENDGWGGTLSALAVGDVDGSGREKIVVGTSRCSLRLIDPPTAKLLWKHYLGDTVTGAQILPGADGRPFIAAASLSEFVSAFNADGDLLWAAPVGAPVAFLAVVWHDKMPALMAVCDDGSVAALNREGSVIGRIKLSARPVAIAVPERARHLLCVAGQDGSVTAVGLPEK